MFEQDLTAYRAPRATWIQTELLLTFPVPTINSITLQPLTSPDTGGRFRVWVNDGQKDTLVWDRKVNSISASECQNSAPLKSDVTLVLTE